MIIEEDDSENEPNSSADMDKENYIEDLAKLSKGIDEGI